MELQTVTKFIAILLIFICLISVLQADKVDDTYQRMLKGYSKLSSWQAVINQTNYFNQTQTTLKSTGIFYYQNKKIAIKYNKPNEQSLIIKDGALTMYDKNSNAVIKSRLTTAVQSLNPVEIVKTYWQKSEKVVLQSTGQSDVLSIKPKKDEQIKDIRVTVNHNTGLISKLIYLDKQGNSVTVTFSKMKVNKSIPDTIWTLKYPKNAQVFEQ